jgi:DNA-binding NtrC family response regulator
MLEQAPEPQAEHPLAVLLVHGDDEHAQDMSDALGRALDGAIVARATSAAGAAELLSSSTWSIAIVDHNLPDRGAFDVLDALHSSHPGLPIVMLTGQGSEELAIEAFRHGASDYVVKGSDYLAALATRVQVLVAA